MGLLGGKEEDGTELSTGELNADLQAGHTFAWTASLSFSLCPTHMVLDLEVY